MVSIHAPLARCDSTGLSYCTGILMFQSTHPLRGATVTTMPFPASILFQSTHPLRGATVYDQLSCCSRQFQSTHPLRGATRLYRSIHLCQHVSIHAPLARCDAYTRKGAKSPCLFQSTHPLRGATCWIPPVNSDLKFQSTHPLRGATHQSAG